MTTDTLLADIIGALDRSGVCDARFPDHRNEYWALYPFHHDTHPTNFTVSACGYNCVACAMAASEAGEPRPLRKARLRDEAIHRDRPPKSGDDELLR